MTKRASLRLQFGQGSKRDLVRELVLPIRGQRQGDLGAIEDLGHGQALIDDSLLSLVKVL